VAGTIINIAVDAMGGDMAPEAPVRGALRALKEFPDDFAITLVGDEYTIQGELERAIVALRYRHDKTRVRIHPADQVITMDDNPLSVIRTKKYSSMHVGVDLLKQGEVRAFVSAGNTGALFLVANHFLGTVEGMRHPALTAVFPTIGPHPCVVLDVGANKICTAEDLTAFALAGELYANSVLDIPRPRVGIMSLGKEEGKGTEAINTACARLAPLFDQLSLPFIGQVEGDSVLSGTVEVIACDGLVGNVILKFAETIFPTLKQGIKEKIRRSPFGNRIFALIGGALLKPTMAALKHDFDYEEYGGAPLLGINGVVIKAHGKSSPKAVANAIWNARQAVANEINAKLVTRLALSPNGRDGPAH
jgi:glycerol-3-phosphate acyltransferase PlsX